MSKYVCMCGHRDSLHGGDGCMQLVFDGKKMVECSCTYFVSKDDKED